MMARSRSPLGIVISGRVQERLGLLIDAHAVELALVTRWMRVAHSGASRPLSVASTAGFPNRRHSKANAGRTQAAFLQVIRQALTVALVKPSRRASVLPREEFVQRHIISIY